MIFMENYEINILKRNGDWKKYNQKELPAPREENINKEKLNITIENDENEYINSRSIINEINSIVNKLEDIENQKHDLKNELKKYEKIFQNQKKNSEHKLSEVSNEIKMFKKTIEVIKNLKDF